MVYLVFGGLLGFFRGVFGFSGILDDFVVLGFEWIRGYFGGGLGLSSDLGSGVWV